MTKMSALIFREKGILFPVLILTGIGLIMVYSSSAAISMEKYQTLFFFAKRQALFFGIGLGVMVMTANFPFKLYRSMAYVILFAALALIVAVLIPQLNVEAGGAHRWLKFGSIIFQPSEPAKLALILFMGYSLTKKQEKIREFSIGFVPHAMIYGLFAVLILLQPDFGTIVVMGSICWGMMFVAGVRLIHLISPLPLIISAVYFLVVKVPYRRDRVLAYLNPWDNQYGIGYQITNSLKAFGAGGAFGKGIGLGIQKLHYLPEPHTDFIFSVIGEELGLAGVLFVLTLYGIILIKGFTIARDSDTLFGSLVATGITLFLGIQVLINTGVAMGALPTKGLTLPFISYGGTSLVVNMAAMGILMNIGTQNRIPQKIKKQGGRP